MYPSNGPPDFDMFSDLFSYDFSVASSTFLGLERAFTTLFYDELAGEGLTDLVLFLESF